MLDQEGTYEYLMANNEYVQRLGDHPQARVSNVQDPVALDIDAQLEEIDLPDAEAEEHARQTGDLKIYYYYFKTAGWGTMALYLFTAVVSHFLYYLFSESS